MKKYIIYRVLNLINRKVYIGRTMGELKKRWSVHKAHAIYDYGKNSYTYFGRSIKKYGINNFEIKQIDEAKDFEHMVWLEAFYIKYYNSTNPKYGYNLIIDKYGEGREFMAEESKKKLTLSGHINRGACGVSWDKARQKWHMNFDCAPVYISKRFNTKEEAQITRDKLSLYFYKENAQLFFPEREEEYIASNLELFYHKCIYKRIKKNKYVGVAPDAKGYVCVLKIANQKDIYLGFYSDEKEAAIVYDKVRFFFGRGAVNFPELVTENYKKEGEEIFKIYSNPNRQIFVKGGKTSKYNGVSKRSLHTWEMSLVREGKERIREIYKNEEDAAMAYDYYSRKFQHKMEKLNFPDRIVDCKPEQCEVKRHKKSNCINPSFSV